MTRERWEVRDAIDNRVWASLGRIDSVDAIRERKMVGDRLVRIRTYRVEVVYAWRSSLPLIRFGWWRSKNVLCTLKSDRAIHTDPLGKHSRRRAKAAAMAAKPAGPCVLVAIRRRVRG